MNIRTKVDFETAIFLWHLTVIERKFVTTYFYFSYNDNYDLS